MSTEADNETTEQPEADSLTPEQAIAQFSAEIEQNPADAVAYLNRGHAYFNAERFDEAISDYRQATKLDPALAEAHLQRGYALVSNGNLSAALDAFRAYSKAVPDDPVGHNNQGFLYLMEGRTSKAEAAWQRATALDGAPDYAYAGHAVALYRLKKRRQAAEMFARAVGMDARWRDDLEAVASEYSWSESMVADAGEIGRVMSNEQ